VKATEIRLNHVGQTGKLFSYSSLLARPTQDLIPISRESVIAFLQQQKARGRQAWQRLQMVKALQFYQTSVCRCEATDLDDIRETLAEFVRRHSSSQPQAEGHYNERVGDLWACQASSRRKRRLTAAIRPLAPLAAPPAAND
jgi:hypothetical protein